MYDLIIIGAGMSGLTSALYAARKRMDFEIISTEFGGQFGVSGEILNYPGIVKTTGVKLSSIMKKQMDFNQVKVKQETVRKVKKKGSHFVVISGKSQYETQAVIIATGARPRKLGIPGEDKLANKGVTYCAVCDGPLFADKVVAVIGGGDAALEAVDFLKDIVSKIYIINLTSELTAHEYLQERVRKNPKVEVILNAKTTAVLGQKNVTGLKYEQNGQEKKLSLQGVFVEIGRTPNTEIFKNIIDLDEHGHIVIDAQCQTSVPGVFAAGDCTSSHEYQYVIAAGQGCMALLKSARYLAKKK